MPARNSKLSWGYAAPTKELQEFFLSGKTNEPRGEEWIYNYFRENADANALKRALTGVHPDNAYNPFFRDKRTQQTLLQTLAQECMAPDLVGVLLELGASISNKTNRCRYESNIEVHSFAFDSKKCSKYKFSPLELALQIKKKLDRDAALIKKDDIIKATFGKETLFVLHSHKDWIRKVYALNEKDSRFDKKVEALSPYFTGSCSQESYPPSHYAFDRARAYREQLFNSIKSRQAECALVIDLLKKAEEKSAQSVAPTNLILIDKESAAVPTGAVRAH